MVLWGWRIPFLLTPVVALICYFTRRSLLERKDVEVATSSSSRLDADIPETVENSKTVYKDLLKYYWDVIVLIILIQASWAPTYYLVFTWYRTSLLALMLLLCLLSDSTHIIIHYFPIIPPSDILGRLSI